MRVAYVVGTVGGGTGEHVAMLARGCAGRGAAVSVYGPAGTGQRFFPGPAESGITLVPVEIAGRPRPARDTAAVLRLRRLLIRATPDVVHAHGLRAGALAALALKAGQRCPLVVTVHNAPPVHGTARAVYALLERIVARQAGAVACVSGDLAARMRRLGAAAVSRAIVPAPPAREPDADAVAAVRAELGAGSHPVVLAVGRLAPQKGFGTLLAAAARWQGSDPCPVLVLAGQGPLDQALRAQADASGIAMRFLGQRDDVPALLASAAVVAVPSVWEGQPLVVQEALRAGRPLVASRTGGIPDLTGEDAAVLVPPGDTDALASAVLTVLGDPALAGRLGAAAAARAAVLPTQDDAVEAVLALYQQLTSRVAA
jgi:glycosyltransferase involved in cell wall biosynthesis